MQGLVKLLKDRSRKSIERDKAYEERLKSIVWKVWPWRDRWLSVLVGVIALLDFGSTYLLLEFIGNVFAYEGGMLAGWALRLGGMRWLFLVDLLVAAVLVSTAFAIRYLFSKLGYIGYGRAFFIVLQLPYVLITAGAIINNILLTSLLW